MRLHPCWAFSRLFFARNPHKLQWLNSPSIYGPFGVNHFQEAVCLWMTHFKLLACCSGPVHVQNLFVYLSRFGQSVFAPKGVWAMCCVCHASTHYIQVHVIFSSVFHDLAWGHEKCCQAWAEGGLWQIHCKKKKQPPDDWSCSKPQPRLSRNVSRTNIDVSYITEARWKH